MLESTKQKYRKNAKGFYRRHFDGYLPTEMQILSRLHRISKDYPPNSFSNIKGYLAFDMVDRGENQIGQAIREFVNPVAHLGYYPKPIRKVKTLSDNEIEKIIDAARRKNTPRTSVHARRRNNQMIAAVWLARYLGCRPSEMPLIRRTGATTFFITSVKKDENGEKGLDRHIDVDDEALANTLAKCIAHLDAVTMSRVRDNFRYLMEKVFPGRKKQPTLYVFRHILGSNLKASDYSREAMAYIMGHQSTRTLENYGYRNAGKVGGLRIKPAISAEEIRPMVRDNHTLRAVTRASRIEAVNHSLCQNFSPHI